MSDYEDDMLDDVDRQKVLRVRDELVASMDSQPELSNSDIRRLDQVGVLLAVEHPAVGAYLEFLKAKEFCQVHHCSIHDDESEEALLLAVKLAHRSTEIVIEAMRAETMKGES